VLVEEFDLQSDGACSFRYLFRGIGGPSIGWIDQHGDANGLGHQLVQQSQPFGQNLVDEKIYSGCVAAGLG
jgi:hypothetical protein